MKKKKGFTLVELIAVIAILAVIITVAGISIIAIKKNVLKKERQNLQSEIKAAAQSYHDETGVTTVPVDVLLQIGTLQADTTTYADDTYQVGDPVILDPVDGDPINCDAVVFDEEGNAKYEYDVGCSADAIAENELVVYYQTSDMTNSKAYSNGTWISIDDGDTVTLSVLNPQKDVEYTWINILAPDKSYTGSKYEIEIPESGVVNSEYRLEATVNNVLLSNEFVLKIDAKSPTIENYYITDENDWKQSKAIYANIIDNESGIYGYAITTKACNKLKDTNYTKLSDITTKEIELTNITENNKYNICVKDNAGHLSTLTDKITVKQVDNVSPKLSVSVSDGSTYTKTKHGTVTLQDFGIIDTQIANFKDGTQVTVKYGWAAKNKNVTCSTSGVFTNTTTIIVSSTQSTYTFDTDEIGSFTGEGYLYVCPSGTIADQAGNAVANTPVKAVMNLDNTNPTASVSISSENTNYNTTTVDITVSGSDSHSGIEYYCLLTSNNVSLCSWQTSGTYSDIDTGKDYDGTSKTYYGFTKDKAGNISSVASSTYTVYKYCNQTYHKNSGDFGTCSKKCDTGIQYADDYYYDKYFTDHYCSTKTNGSSQDCNTQACCSNTTVAYTDGTTCSKSCGGGTYNQIAYSTIDTNVKCPDFDLDEGGESCNAQSCCSSDYDETINAYRYSGCTKVYITSCQPDCNSTAYCKNSSGTKYDKSKLTKSQPDTCCTSSKYWNCEVVYTHRIGNTAIYNGSYWGDGYMGTVTNKTPLYLISVGSTSVYVRSKYNYHSTNAYTSNPEYYGYIYKTCIDKYKGNCPG